MSEGQESLFSKLSDSVLDMDEKATVELSQKVVEEEYDVYDAIEHGLSDGMDRAGKLFEEEEYFIPELLMCSDAMYAGLDVLKPHLVSQEAKQTHKIVIGVVEGDTHDIGKNLVKTMLETAGFEIIDLGRDIKPRTFVEKAKEAGAEIIALSTLMTTTMGGMEEVVQVLDQEGIRSNFKVIVGGGPISQGFAEKIGADGYAVNAADAVRLVKKLVSATV
jgi:dimethylamine corrinoid protein